MANEPGRSQDPLGSCFEVFLNGNLMICVHQKAKEILKNALAMDRAPDIDGEVHPAEVN
jgi:hypothetical protein